MRSELSSTNRGASHALAAFFVLLASIVPLRAGADGNILLIILDDVGVDMIGAYQSIEQSNMVPPTLNIDELAAHGITFSNVWAGPSCGPTRVTIQTGQYGYRLLRRFGTAISPGTTLDEATLGIADVLNANSALGYQKAMIGKWGLRNPSGPTTENLYAEDDFRHIVRSGYDYFVGKPDCCIDEGYHDYLDGSAQFNSAACDPSVPGNYQTTGCITCPVLGQDTFCDDPSQSENYATTENVNDALAWIADRPGGQNWFLTLSLNAAHFPFDAPPAHLTTADLSSHVVEGTNECKSTVPAEQACYRAGVEAADREIGRLLAAVDGNETTVFVLGDNGSVGAHDRVDGGVSVPPFDPIRSKQTLYQGGINVPLIAWGKSVILELDTLQEKIGRRSDALVNASDLFATLLDIAGIGVADLPADPSAGSVAPDIDSYSILPILEEGCSTGCLIDSIRHYAYSEASWSDRRGKTIRNRRGYKLILHDDGFHRKVPGEDPGTFDDEDITEEGLEFYYLGGDPSPLMAGLEDRRENHDLWIDEPEPGQPGELDGSRLSPAQRTYLQPIFDDLLERLGPSGQGPNLAAANKCDINLDGRIDSADVLRVMQLAGSGSGEPGEVARADVAPPNDPLGGDGDGVIDSADVLLLLRAVSGDDVTSCDHTLL